MAQEMASDISTVLLYELGLRMCLGTSKALVKSGYVFEGQKVNFSCRLVLLATAAFSRLSAAPRRAALCVLV